MMLLYLDCDTGVDDALAIALLLTHDEITLAGIGTVTGNTTATQAAANTLGLLRLAGRTDIPVAVGGGGAGGAPHVHGGNGVGGAVLPHGGAPDPRTAVEMLLDLARQHPGELHILATGPCTNLAAALRAEPRLPELIAGVTFMGGAVHVAGNVTRYAEANVATDPAAVAEVFAAPWLVTLVPLDVSMNHRWSIADAEALRAAGTPLTEALADMLPTYFDSYEPRLGERVIPLHDPLAAALVAGDLRVADAPGIGVRVDLAQARIVADQGAADRVRVVLKIDRPAGPVILERLRNPSPGSREAS
jgi:purine nucleosidase